MSNARSFLRWTLVATALPLCGCAASPRSDPGTGGSGSGGRTIFGTGGGFGTGGEFFGTGGEFFGTGGEFFGTGGVGGQFSGNGGAGFDPTCANNSFGGGSGPPVTVPGIMSAPEFGPNLGTTKSQDAAPPAISGGTLLVLANGKTAVASDPDRDMIYVADLPSHTLTWSINLGAGDEPGRVVQDAAGRVHVALRHGGAVVTCDPGTGTITARRPVCAAPRGLAYEPATDQIHVACHDGNLVSLPAAGGEPVRRLHLDDDLRDVVVDGTNLLVSRFRTAQVLTVGSDGSVIGRGQPTSFSAESARAGSVFTPSTAWRMLPAPDGGAMMLHQRGMVDPVMPAPGGYGGLSPCDSIVHTCVTHMHRDGSATSGPPLASLVLAVDLALSPDGRQLAVVSAGNATNLDAFAGGMDPALTRVFMTDVDSATDPQTGCSPDGIHGPCLPKGLGFGFGPITPVASSGAGGAVSSDSGGSNAMRSGSGGSSGVDVCAQGFQTAVFQPGVPVVVGQPVAVAFDGGGSLVVQSREPAMLALADGTTIVLSTVSRADTGHTLFHANSGGFLACASCHPEGNEDGRVWNFACEGQRRTQSVQTGLQGTEPFHWGGDEMNFTHLMTDVFAGRMSGPTLTDDQGSALLSWLDKQPRAPKPAPADAAAVSRGQALFNDPIHACATCHSGTHLTNNQTVDVGTGGPFQVPSLVGVGSRGPYMHDGCAATLADRFGACGGGDHHGITSTLGKTDVTDLVAYLQTL